MGHIACRRRIKAHFERADKLFRRLKAARLDASYDAEVRKLIGADLLIIDDFALQALDATETADFYEIVVERHKAGATLLTSNRDPSEWLGMLADPLLAQSAVDRLQTAAWELVIEGESYRGARGPPSAGRSRERRARRSRDDHLPGLRDCFRAHRPPEVLLNGLSPGWLEGGPPRPAEPVVARSGTVYECPACEARYLGDQRCQDCNTWCRRVGPGALCPHCDGPVAITDLFDRRTVGQRSQRPEEEAVSDGLTGIAAPQLDTATNSRHHQFCRPVSPQGGPSHAAGNGGGPIPLASDTG